MKTAIFMESTGVYHLTLFHFLRDTSEQFKKNVQLIYSIPGIMSKFFVFKNYFFLAIALFFQTLLAKTSIAILGELTHLSINLVSLTVIKILCLNVVPE
ncbi:hypothetical protein AC231_13530 [Clostridium pasteurianum]|nr:hypothetical protein AC231_13530 [Clostridium pasteurianum]